MHNMSASRWLRLRYHKYNWGRMVELSTVLCKFICCLNKYLVDCGLHKNWIGLLFVKLGLKLGLVAAAAAKPHNLASTSEVIHLEAIDWQVQYIGTSQRKNELEVFASEWPKELASTFFDTISKDRGVSPSLSPPSLPSFKVHKSKFLSRSSLFRPRPLVGREP